ncbi:hypothetical protein BS50DRAFT_504392 [Corynespora cassiicola Philippines]|uniref:Uncharacterized protein n=1 Tax=Corynespora cassiicola Philippines TaxID=1448308 RepID=A0A2T2N7V3_CORCC|nr:hypothetical protein BS50DRAFT_504392 [Corynespora cassiicola Philippines]
MSKEIDQSLPLLENEEADIPTRKAAHKPAYLRKLSRPNFTILLSIYAILATAVVIFQSLSRKVTPNPYSIYFSAVDEEVKSSNEEPDDTVKLLDMDGYLGTIGVYHGLHCMRRIYWHLHEETYFPNRTSEARSVEIVHARHCLGVVVRDLMCNPDTALYTFGYYPDRDPIPRLKSGAKRQCLKWDPFHKWATERAPGYYPRLQAPANLLKGKIGHQRIKIELPSTEGRLVE